METMVPMGPLIDERGMGKGFEGQRIGGGSWLKSGIGVEGMIT